ncbi:MAG TPA: alpha-hydroxy acid oxidase [Thermoanaerobaculia bacterium]|jgi:4-hydroxymandelate oxidase|nr:alpha-hydroxy acid oxidase [Thermoanaerobaculia bacterium]
MTELVTTLSDFEAVARERLATMVYDYVAGAAGDEISLRRNCAAFDTLLLKPRVLRDVSRLDAAVELFGMQLPFPILLAPAAYHRMVHPEGELETARGAGAAGAVMVVSSLSNDTFEEIAAVAGGPLWFQLYVQKDRAFTRDLVQRVEAAGCQAICITVDTPILGTRRREVRDRFELTAGLERANLRGCKGATSDHVDESGVYSEVLDAALTWEGIDWIRGFAKVPILLKGILAPEDAALAVEHGVSGIIVSNHGARNLDTTPATIEALPGVVEVVDGRMPVLLDGGIRRGTDVIKALALGARAVLIGRPYLWGLAAAGAAGVASVVKLLRTELLAAMALCGRPSLAQIDRSVLWSAPASPAGPAQRH